MSLLRRALDAFPLSVDALNCWASLYNRRCSPPQLDKAEATYKLALKDALLLWPEVENQESVEWGHVEYRSFLRAHHGPGVVHQELGRTSEAIETFRYLLKVNPSDNQGARSLLFESLIEAGEYQSAEEVAEKHSGGRESTDACFRYGFLIIDYLKHKLGSCSSDQLFEILVGALECNHYVPSLLLGDIPLPPLPKYVSSGIMDEATSVVTATKGTWGRTPGILEWFGEQRAKGGENPNDDGVRLSICYREEFSWCMPRPLQHHWKRLLELRIWEVEHCPNSAFHLA